MLIQYLGVTNCKRSSTWFCRNLTPPELLHVDKLTNSWKITKIFLRKRWEPFLASKDIIKFIDGLSRI